MASELVTMAVTFTEFNFQWVANTSEFVVNFA